MANSSCNPEEFLSRSLTSVLDPGSRDLLQGAGARAVKNKYRGPEPLNFIWWEPELDSVKNTLKTAPRSREPGLI